LLQYFYSAIIKKMKGMSIIRKIKNNKKIMKKQKVMKKPVNSVQQEGINAETMEKFKTLKGHLASLGSIAVAFSGGVDSSFLLKTASEVLGDRVIAVTIKSPSIPARELERAIAFTKKFNIRHIIAESCELDNPDFVKNDRMRCYYCKKEEFGIITQLAKKNKLAFVADGQNFDDMLDYRPGSKASQELGVLSPLRTSQLTKEELRLLSRQMGLVDWDRPALACLSSRIPYGTEIDENLLKKIDYLESFLVNWGFKQVRVRHHGEIARIEITKKDFSRLFKGNLIEEIISEFKKNGYLYITLDLEGYRMGSMNKSSHPAEKKYSKNLRSGY